MAKVTFETDDPQEILRLAKSDEMANFIWELVNNGWRDLKKENYDYYPAWKKINELLEEHNININELTG